MTEIQIRVEAEKSLGEGMGLWGITGCSFYGFFPNITGDYADMLYVWYMAMDQYLLIPFLVG